MCFERISGFRLFNMYYNMFPMILVDVTDGACPMSVRSAVHASKWASLEVSSSSDADLQEAAPAGDLLAKIGHIVVETVRLRKYLGKPEVFVIVITNHGSVMESILSHQGSGRYFATWFKSGVADEVMSLQGYAMQVTMESLYPKYAACTSLLEPRGEVVTLATPTRLSDTAGTPPLFGVQLTPVAVRPKPHFATEIAPDFLFLGDFENASSEVQLTALGITHVVDATNEAISRSACAKLGLKYLAIDIHDHPSVDISAYFPAVSDFVRAARAEPVDRHCRVLIHCRAGISRSASLVVAVLMNGAASHPSVEWPTGEGLSLREALGWVIAQRPIIFPNFGFLDCLLRYELETRGAAPSFQNRTEAEIFLSKRGILYSPMMFREGDADRVVVGRHHPVRYDVALPGEHGEASHQTSAAKVAPRPFLKRGEGKRVRETTTSK